MLALKMGRRVVHSFNCTPCLSNMRLPHAFVFFIQNNLEEYPTVYYIVFVRQLKLLFLKKIIGIEYLTS